MRVKDFPGRTLTVEQQGSVTGRDWRQELGLPYYFEEWEEMAKLRSDEPRGRVTFIAMDESPTQLVGHPRMQPKQIALPTQCSLELGHTGFLIGALYGYFLGRLPPGLNVPLPTLEGDFIVGQATFFDSALAEKAQEGVQRNIFSHVCPVVWSTEGAPVGTGLLVQLSLVPGDYPGCPNARVLGWSG
jgi:hypothetical protein